jgi:hypothetical protein
MRADLAHDYGVCELRDQVAGAIALRAGEDFDGEDAAQQLRPKSNASSASGRRNWARSVSWERVARRDAK